MSSLRKPAGDERGFSLIELLVVILIIGILAAIAIPSFLSQKDKAGDAGAKSYVRGMQTAQEAYFTENATYSGLLSELQTVEPALNNVPNRRASPTASGDRVSFTVAATSAANVTFTIARARDGTVRRSCDRAGVGGCNGGSSW